MILSPNAVGDPLGSEIPKDFYLAQNYPNPFNPSTTIQFGVPRASEVTIEIYNVLGRKVATLIEGNLVPGVHNVDLELFGMFNRTLHRADAN